MTVQQIADELYKKANLELINKPDRTRYVEDLNEMLALMYVGEHIKHRWQVSGTYYHSVVVRDIVFIYVHWCPLVV